MKKKFTIELVKNLDKWNSVLLIILVLVLPFSVIILLSRLVPEESPWGWVLLVLLITVPILILILLSLAHKAGKFNPEGWKLIIENSDLKLYFRKKLIKTFDLSKKHKLLVVSRELPEKYTLPLWLEVYLMQNGEKISFQVEWIRPVEADWDEFVELSSNQELERLKETLSQFRCVVPEKSLRRDFLKKIQGTYPSLLDFNSNMLLKEFLNCLSILDSYYWTNTMVPYIDMARNGEFTISELKKLFFSEGREEEILKEELY